MYNLLAKKLVKALKKSQIYKKIHNILLKMKAVVMLLINSHHMKIIHY